MANNNSPEAMAKILVQVKKHAYWMRKNIDKIKAEIVLKEQKLEDDKWLEMRKKKREEDTSITISTAKPIIRAV